MLLAAAAMTQVSVIVAEAGRATVMVDGVVVGEVERRSEHYNLRRPCTVTYWLARPQHGPVVREHYRLRREAVDALVRLNRSER